MSFSRFPSAIAAALSLGVLMATSPAQAADQRLPVKAPLTAPASDWSGFYLGLNAGYGVARNPSTQLGQTFGPTTESFSIGPAGFIGGAQAGYNWQWAQWVLGAEADLQFASQKDSACMLRCLPISGVPIEQKLTWFGTVRGRLGWSTGPALLYATGGLAYGHIDNKVTRIDGANPIENYTFGHTKTGWTIGGGIEAALAGDWSAKAEYLYVDLGGVSDSYMHLGLLNENVSSSVRNNIFRAGLNYRFSDGTRAYASARPASIETATHAWNGFYAGFNAGYGVARNPSTFTAVGFQPQNESFNMDPAGLIGGIQIGVNTPLTSGLIAGIEADLQASGQQSSDTCTVLCLPATPVYLTVDQKLKWLGTVRGRLGWAAGASLFYATGGLAYGKVETHAVYTSQALLGGAPNVLAILDMSSIRTGWTVGGGIETALSGPWSVKVEYLYLDLGSQSASATNDFGLGFTNVTTASTSFRDNLVRIGLNYKLY